MTDDKTADTAAKWTFTEPKKDAECWKDLVAYSDKECKTADEKTKVVKTMKVGAKDETA